MRTVLLVLVAMMVTWLTGCGVMQDDEQNLQVYFHEEDVVREMALETYLEGVVAGEMKNIFPMEALKAQAIVARTYTLAKMAEGKLEHHDADASTDIREFQAYQQSAINDAVKQAVQMTRGQVLEYDGKPIMAWFHAAAGGKTATAEEGLGYTKHATPYIVPVLSREDASPDDVKEWEAVFTQEEVTAALTKLGHEVTTVESIMIAGIGPSGRATRLLVNGSLTVDAPSLRMALGSTRLPSMLLSDTAVNERAVRFQGSGYGHGVGMSQWGAYQMAEEGMTAEEIVAHYYPGATLVKRWE